MLISIFSNVNIVFGISLIEDRGPYGNFYGSPLYLKIKEKINFVGPSKKSFADYLSEIYENDDNLSRYDQLGRREKQILSSLMVHFDNLSGQSQFIIRCNCASHENGDIEELRDIIDLISQETENI